MHGDALGSRQRDSEHGLAARGFFLARGIRWRAVRIRGCRAARPGRLRGLHALDIGCGSGAICRSHDQHHPSCCLAILAWTPMLRALVAARPSTAPACTASSPPLTPVPCSPRFRVPVLPGDSAESLGQRVLAREHPLLVQTVIAISEGKLALRKNRLVAGNNPVFAPVTERSGPA